MIAADFGCTRIDSRIVVVTVLICRITVAVYVNVSAGEVAVGTVIVFVVAADFGGRRIHVRIGVITVALGFREPVPVVVGTVTDQITR